MKQNAARRAERGNGLRVEIGLGVAKSSSKQSLIKNGFFDFLPGGEDFQEALADRRLHFYIQFNAYFSLSASFAVTNDMMQPSRRKSKDPVSREHKYSRSFIPRVILTTDRLLNYSITKVIILLRNEL